MKKIFLRILLVIIAIVFGTYFYMYKVFIPNYIANFVPTAEKIAEEYIYGTVKIGGLRWDGGLSLYAQNVEIKNAYKEPVAAIPEIEVALSTVIDVDNPVKMVSAININKPTVYLSVGEHNRWNINKLLKPSEASESPFYGDVNINDGHLDVKLPEHHWKVSLEGKIIGKANPIYKVDLLLDKEERHLKVVADIDTKDSDNLKGVGTLALKELTYDQDSNQVGTEVKGVEAYTSTASVNSVLIPFTIEGKKVKVAAEVDKVRINDLKLSKLLLDGSYDGETWQLDHLSMFSGEGALALSASYKDSDGSLAVDGRLSEFPISPLMDYFGISGAGLASTNFAIRGSLYDPSCGSVVALKDAEFFGQKLRAAYGFIGIKDNVLSIKKYIAHMQQGYHVIDGTVDLNGDEPVLDINLKTKNIRIEPLVALLAPNVQITGNIDNQVYIKGAVSDPQIRGKIQASDGSTFKQLWSGIEGEYSYIDKTLTLKNFLVKAFYGTVFLDGTMNPAHELNFKFVGNNMDIAHLPFDTAANKLAGLVNLEGQLLGTMEAPVFKGSVKSDKIAINDQSLTELQGMIEANGRNRNVLDISFKQPHSSNADEYGYFVAKGTLDIPDRFLQGKVHMMNADAHSLLLMCKQDYQIFGAVNGVLDISPKGKGTGIDIDVDATDIYVHKLNYYEGRFKGKFLKGLLTFEDVRLQENEVNTGSGIIKVTGSADLWRRTVDMQLSAIGADPAIVTAVMKKPIDIHGVADMAISLKGTWQEPVGKGSIMVHSGSVEGVPFDSLIAEVSLANDDLRLDTMRAASGPHYVDAYGDIPIDLFRNRSDRRNPDAELDITLDFSNASLDVLRALTRKKVEWGIGSFQGKLQAKGTLEEPLFYGSLKVKDGSLKLKDIYTPIEKLNLDVEFMGNKLELAELSTKLGKGSLRIDGTYALRTTEDAVYRLHMVAKDAEIASKLITTRLNGEGEIVPQKYPDFANRHGNNVPMAYRPMVKGKLRVDDFLANFPAIPDFDDSNSNIGLDCALELGPKVHFLNTALYDFYLKGGVTIKGSTRFPSIDGNISVKKGTINYLRNRFDIIEGKTAWIDIGSFLPNITLRSTTRFSQYRVFLDITGPIEHMELKLTSEPSLDKNTIMRMLTLQRDIDGNTDVTNEDVTNIMTAGLAMSVLGDAELIIKQTLGFDEFRIYTGPVRSGMGLATDTRRTFTKEEEKQYNLLVSKYLTDRLLLGYTTNFKNTDTHYFTRFDISDRFYVYYDKQYLLDETDKKDYYGFEYRTSF